MTNDIFDISKALDTSTATTGSLLVPEIIQPGIRMMVEQRSPLWNIVNKEPIEGYSYAWREQNGLPVASFGAELGALPAAQNATYIEKSVPIKSIYIRGELSGQIQAATRSVINILQREINNSTIGMIRTLEQKLINGDSSVNPNEFDGIAKWITNVLDARPTGTGSDAPLSLALLDQLIDLPVGGEPTHLFVGKAMRRKLWSVLQPQVRYMDKTTVQGGFEVPSYGGLPIIEFFENDTVFNNQILAPDMTQVIVPVLKDVTYEELAKTRDSVDYFLKMYLSVVVTGGARYHAKATHVSSAIA